MNDENLKNGKATQFTSGEVAARNGRKGGLAKSRKCKQTKTIADTIKMLMKQKVGAGKVKDKLIENGITDEDVTIGAAFAYSILTSAMDGNAQAMKLALDLAGENPELNHKREIDKALLQLKEREVKAKEEGW